MKSKGRRRSEDTEALYYQTLHQIAKAANSTPSIKDFLNLVVKDTARTLKAFACSVMFFDPGKKRLVHSITHGLSDWYRRKGPVDAEESMAEIREGKVVAIADALSDSRTQYPEMAEQEGIASVLSVPLAQKGEVIGALRVYAHEQREFSQQERDFLSGVAELTSIVLERAELEESLERELKATKKSSEPEIIRPPLRLARLESFAHPSEEEFARLLDFYRLEWLYEPRSFPLRWEGEKVMEWFTPDFYLPDLDLYVELTTLKQSLITEKNRKLRRLRELYPEINIKLLNKKDYHSLLAKYGYGPLAEAKGKGIDRVLFNRRQIERRVRELGTQISSDYADQQILLIGVLKGVVCFMADLIRHISVPLAIDFLAISYYGSPDSEAVRITKDLDRDISGAHVLMVEDIVDTGMTLHYILNYLLVRGPASLEVCALLDKRVRRLIDVPLKYVGFEIPDEFVVGYGLDYQGEYRNLPFIGMLTPKILKGNASQTKSSE